MVRVPRRPDFLRMSHKIISIRNKHTGESVPFTNIEISSGVHMYSSRKESPKMCLYINGKHASKHTPYLISYECGTCHSHVEVGMSQIIRHLQKEKPRCRYCVNLEEEKRLNQSIFMSNKETNKDIITHVNISSLSKKELKSVYEKEFAEEIDHDEYYSYHLTEEEFQRLRHGIISISETVEYWPVWKCNNQMRYTAMTYNPVTDHIDKVYNLKCKCDVCDTIFPIKNLHSLKNKYKLLCKECSFCRFIFKKRSIVNLRGEKVVVQCKQEINFVYWCNENNIIVINGPKLKYVWKEINCTYHVDFELPEINWLIELKDNHCWHQRQVESGKWGAKENVAKAQKGKHFIVVYPKTWMEVAKDILREFKLKKIG